MIEKNRENLIDSLNQKIDGEIRFDPGSRALYATDGSNYRQVPIGVIIPRTIQAAIDALGICHQYEVPVLSRGGGTSLAGQCCNVAVVIDFSKYLGKILSIDAEKKLAWVQPGCVLDNLREAANHFELTFGPDPSTHNHNTLGGMLGNDSCGVHSVLSAFEGTGARTMDNVQELEIITYDGCRFRVGETSEQELEFIIKQGGRRGQIYSDLKKLRDRYANLIRERYPNIPRRVSGYNLEQLLPENNFNVAKALVGTEGTCVMIVEACLKLVYNPPKRALMIIGYPDVYTAGDHIPEILTYKPCGLEGIDDLLTQYMRKKKLNDQYLHLLPEGKGWLFVEFGGRDQQEADDKANRLMSELKKKNNPPSMRIVHGEQAESLWKVRRSGLGATADVPGQPSTWEGWEDSAVPPEKVGEYLRKLKKLFEKYDYESSLYGHFGQGCVHCRIPFDLKTEPGLKKFRAFLDEAADLVVSLGGSISGEHGDGQSKAELLPKMFGNELINAFQQFKLIWDPQEKMNPKKMVFPYKITENLRLGTQYNPWNPQTHFKFADDNYSFAEAGLRCVGVGECRREKESTMCPSYRVTKEEKHSTRGRARLLFEMLRGEVIGKNRWRDHSVKEALDLCLACKGCKGDCPVNVDMATYKSEFLSHYYSWRIRPRSAYFFGFIYWWSKIATQVPTLFNFFTQKPFIKNITKAMVGMAQPRDFPVYAQQNFRKWWQQRSHPLKSSQKIILWVDTFNNFFHPEILIAAVNILESLNYEIIIPQQALCCGRPLYDFGFLNLAKKLLLDIVKNLKTEIRDGTSLLALEPSCLAVFRDELKNLFPHNEDAIRLSKQSYSLCEFLLTQVKNYHPPKLQRKAVLHGHCQQKSIIKLDHEIKLLQEMGLQLAVLDAGCCGMAGSFGYEKGERYSVSIKVGEHVLLPTVRQTDPDTLIIADGFSCKNQIYGCTSRKTIHIAEVIQMGINNHD